MSEFEPDLNLFEFKFKSSINEEFIRELREKNKSGKDLNKKKIITNLITISKLYVFFKKQNSKVDADIIDLFSRFEKDIIDKTREMLIANQKAIQGIHMNLDSLIEYTNQYKNKEFSDLSASNTKIVQDIKHRQTYSEASDSAMLANYTPPNPLTIKKF